MALTGINISPREPSWQSVTHTLASYLPLVLIAAVTIAYGLRLLSPPTLWLDEAMLFVNVRDITWDKLLSPLPYYDQAGPLAYIALLKLIHSIAGLSETMLRLPSWLALIATLALISRLPETSRTARIITAALIAGSFVTARIVTDAKPYMLEAMFAFALIIAFHPASQGLWTRTPTRLALLITAMLSTTAFPLVAFAVGAPAVLLAARSDLASRRPPTEWRCLKPATILAVALAIYALYFVGYLAPSLKLIAANHAYGYGPSGFAPENAVYLQWLQSRLFAVIAGHWRAAALVVALSAIVGSYILVRNRSVYAAQIGALIAILITANLSGHFPLMEERFSIFLLPWLSLATATAAATAITLLTTVTLRSGATIALTALLLYPAIDTIRDPFHQDASRSLTHIRANPAIPLVTTMAGQSIIDAYLTSENRAASSCSVPAAEATTNRCTAAKSTTDGTFAKAATKWYLMNYIAVRSWGGSDHGFPGRSVDAFAAAYYDWIAANLRRHQRAHLLLVQGNAHVVSAIQQRLRPGEKLFRVVDDRPASPTLAHSAGQLFLFESTASQR